MKNKALAIGILTVSLSTFTSWYPFLATILLLNNIAYVVIAFIISSIISITLSLIIYRYKKLVNLLNIVLAIILIITYALGISLNITYSWLVVLALLLTLAGYLGKAYSLLIRSSIRIPDPLKPKILERITTRSWLYGFIGCALFSFIASNMHVEAFIGLISIITSITLVVQTFLLKPYVIIEEQVKENVARGSLRLYIPLIVYASIVVFALNIYYPFLPVYVKEYIGLNIIGIGLFYASITVLSRVMFSIAQLIIAVKDPTIAFTARSLLAGLLLLTASTSENPWFTLILLTIVLSSTPLHTLAYSVFAKKMGIKLTMIAETIYTVIGIPAILFGYNLWLRNPILVIATPALVLLISVVFTGYLRRYKNIISEESSPGQA